MLLSYSDEKSKRFAMTTYVAVGLIFTGCCYADIVWNTSVPLKSPPQCESVKWPYFLCSDVGASCFTMQQTCDGHSDCVDGEDECHSMCHQVFLCNSTFHSQNYQCIAMDQFCDGVPNCHDGSDEMEESEEGFSCSNGWRMFGENLSPNEKHWKERRVPWDLSVADQWTRGKTDKRKCRLPDKLVCDGINHCGDHADECSSAANCNDDVKFICNNGRCISKTSFCDRRDDCGDASDECHENCTKSYRCNNGECISISQFCDGVVNCNDSSDEVTDLAGFKSASFFSNSVMCSNIANFHHGKCFIPSKYLCDGEEHCYDREDECVTGCQYSFLCPDGRCFVSAKKCDGIGDCDDMSDECNPDCDVRFDCDNGTCLSLDRFCDGVNDCSNGEDEIDNTNLKHDTSVFCTSHKSSLSKSSNRTCLLPERFVCDDKDQCMGRSDECEVNCRYSFQCDDGHTCIHRNQVNNELIDCQDQSDEPGFGLKTYYQRGFKCRMDRNGDTKMYVLPQKLLRDNVADCIDFSDLCFDKDVETGYESAKKCVPCQTGKEFFISDRQVCDGVFDCPDLSDECLCVDGRLPFVCTTVCYHKTSPECQCEPGYVPCLGDDQFFNSSVTLGCIPLSKFCDGVIDCPNAADERYCSGHGNISAVGNRMECSFFKHDSVWTPRYAYSCDSRPECFYMEDECDSNCDTVPEFCSSRTSIGSYNCPDQRILPGKMVCNGRADCRTADYDERACAKRFSCGNGSRVLTIELYKVCDYIIDCDTENDEKGCGESHFYCNSTQPLYIPSRKRLDGSKDCSDGSDECPQVSGISSRDYLISSPFLQLMVWIMGLAAVLGNCSVFIYTAALLGNPTRNKLTKVAVINNVLILNLALADFLMGIFLCCLAGKHALTAGHYCQSDRAWRSGWACTSLGVLAALSAEVSLSTLAILASYRLYCVLRPMKSREIKIEKTFFYLSCTWVIGCVIAFVPLSPPHKMYFVSNVWIQNNSYFASDLVSIEKLRKFCVRFARYNDSLLGNFKVQNGCRQWDIIVGAAAESFPTHVTQGYMGYYSSHATCLPRLFLQRNEQGWEFSLATTCFNFLVCLYIVAVYVALWCTRHVKTSARANQGSKNLQRRIALLVCTDCACWMPICTIAFFRFAGMPMSDSTYAFTAVILLPINSALNPVFYSNALQNFFAKATARFNKFETLDKLRKNVRNACANRCTAKPAARLAEAEACLLTPTASHSVDTSRAITELTIYDFSSVDLPESTV